jgi:transcriptional regulator with PAS, ATPase and Fis domain
MKSQAAVDIFEFGGFVGKSPQIQGLSVLLARVAGTAAPLLVLGEPGTYKEAFAEAVHQKSGRTGPFLVVDCGGQDPDALESELFGDERAKNEGRGELQPGVFEAAAGGTVFLGEVAELSIELQSKVLRVVERQQVRRIGAAGPIPVTVRVIASTSRSLRADLEEKRVRNDFYYRMTTLQVRIPPLRERLEDIPALVKAILHELGIAESPEAAPLLDPDFLATLSHYSWPGNVRQLRHHIERCSALADVSLPPSMDTFPSMSGSFRVARSVDSLKMLKVARKV